MGDRSTITLELPADARFLLVARSVVAGTAAGLAFPYDAVEDLRIAVTEAISVLLALPAPKDRITLDMETDVDGLQIQVSSDAAGGPWPPEGVRELDGIPWRIITQLVDDAVARRNEGRPSIQLTRRTLASGSA